MLTTNGMDVLYSGLSRKRTNAGDGVTFFHEEEFLPLLGCLVGSQRALRHLERTVPLVDVIKSL